MVLLGNFQGWTKLDCDGAYKSNQAMAGCGGLLRDGEGKWITGHFLKIGNCNALQVGICGNENDGRSGVCLMA